MSFLAAPRPQRSPLVASRQIEHHAADMVVTVGTEVTLGETQAQLAERGQWLALDGDPARPMGWLMQHDSTGPLRLGYGGWRDVLTGVQFTDGEGNLVTAGGITVKNVAGYDLVKFVVGSHGCFGTPVSMTLRTYRRPEAALVTSLTGDFDETAQILESDAPPHWMLWRPKGLRAGWLGREREIASLASAVEQITGTQPQRRSLEEDEAERRRLLGMGIEEVRLYVPPADIAGLTRELAGWDFVADPVFGVVWMAMPETFSAVLAAVSRRGGHAVWLGRDGVRVYGVGRDAQALLRRLKPNLDPEGKLPGLPFVS